jgi:hypothetical protein
MSLAVVVIASEKRRETTLPLCFRSVWDAIEPSDEVLVIGDWEGTGPGYVRVAPITRTTIDALVKRDVGWLMTTADAVLFLCDDHRLDQGFMRAYREKYEGRDDWDILCPSRHTIRGQAIIPLNVGRAEGYVGGHAGIYRRTCARLLPWSAGPHHRNWDLLHTHELIRKGARLVYADTDLAVEDIEPGATPWM